MKIDKEQSVISYYLLFLKKYDWLNVLLLLISLAFPACITMLLVK